MLRENKSLGALGSLVGYHLRRANSSFVLDFGVAMNGTGMRQVLVGVLAVVANEPGIKQVAVGRILGIKKANMVSLINELIEMGLIERTVDKVDRRAFALAVTPKGHDKLDDCFRRIAAHEKRMLADFSCAEKSTLIDLLTRIGRKAPADG